MQTANWLWLVAITLNFEGKTGYLFREFVIEKGFDRCPWDTENRNAFAPAKSAFRKFAYSARAVYETVLRWLRN